MRARTTFAMMGDHAIYHDDWIASTKVIRPPWEIIDPVTLVSLALRPWLPRHTPDRPAVAPGP